MEISSNISKYASNFYQALEIEILPANQVSTQLASQRLSQTSTPTSCFLDDATVTPLSPLPFENLVPSVFTSNNEINNNNLVTNDKKTKKRERALEQPHPTKRIKLAELETEWRQRSFSDWCALNQDEIQEYINYYPYYFYDKKWNLSRKALFNHLKQLFPDYPQLSPALTGKFKSIKGDRLIILEKLYNLKLPPLPINWIPLQQLVISQRDVALFSYWQSNRQHALEAEIANEINLWSDDYKLLLGQIVTNFNVHEPESAIRASTVSVSIHQYDPCDLAITYVMTHCNTKRPSHIFQYLCQKKCLENSISIRKFFERKLKVFQGFPVETRTKLQNMIDQKQFKPVGYLQPQ